MVKTDHIISSTGPDLLVIKSKNDYLLFSGFWRADEPYSQNKRKLKIDKYLDLAR